jgi:hypothetical protein
MAVFVKRGFSLLVPLIMCIVPISLMADSREEYAQDLIGLAEKHLAQGNKAEAVRIADIVISEFSDTRAVHKAEEIKRLAGSDATRKAPTTKSRTVTSGEPDPGKACAWGIIPGGGLLYLGSYYSKVNNQRKATGNYLGGVGALIGIPVTVAGGIGCIYKSQHLDGGTLCLDLDPLLEAGYLFLGIVFLGAAAISWPGSAIGASVEARKIQKGDTLSDWKIRGF